MTKVIMVDVETVSRASKCDYKYYNLSVYQIGNQEWAIGTKSQFYKIAIERIKEELWAFRAAYLADFLEEKKVFPTWSQKEWQVFMNSLTQMQEKMCEDATPMIEALLGPHLESFIETAIEDDGLGHFVSSYDSEIYKTKDVEGFNKGLGPLCVRIN